MFVKKKVFDCQDMPKDIREHFFETFGEAGFGRNPSNDSYVEVICYSPEVVNNEGWDYVAEHLNPVIAWLCANGADMDEEVLFKHWW